MGEKVSSIAPIQSYVNNVFVHVSDLKKSVEWYAKLLGITIDLSEVHSPVHNIPVTGQTGLSLDDHTFDPSFLRAPGTGRCLTCSRQTLMLHTQIYRKRTSKSFVRSNGTGKWHGST